jgi:uncharacterized protein DUF559
VVEICIPRGKGSRPSGTIVHETRSFARVDTMVLDAIPVTSVARTLIDCASLWRAGVLEEALDDALRRGLISLPMLRRRAARLASGGSAGTAALRRLLASRDGRRLPESVLERRLLRLIARADLPPPDIQYEICEEGRLLARVDLAYPSVRLAIEADGYRYHSGRGRWQRDLTRRNALTAIGWHVVHVTAEDVQMRATEVCRTIALALARAEGGN